MPEMTDADWERLRDRCNDAAVADGKRLGIPLTQVQANVAYDAMVDLIRQDLREHPE